MLVGQSTAKVQKHEAIHTLCLWNYTISM